MSPWWLLLFVPLALVAGAFVGAYGIQHLREQTEVRRMKEDPTYQPIWLPPAPPALPPQAAPPRVSFTRNRPGNRRSLRGHRPK